MIARYPLSKVTVWVGALPVVIKPELQIFVGASGQVEAGITTGVHQEASVTIGADYVRGRAGSDFKDLSTASFDSGFDPPTLHAAAELKGYAGIKLATAVYGVAGPYAALQGFGRLTADINEDPWWTLDVGLEAQVGFEMKALKFKYGWTFTLFEYEIAHAEDPAPEKPAIAVDAVTNGTDPPYIAVGGPITWTYRVTNPGSVPLSSVTVDDDMLASADDPAYESGDANADGKLDRTETWVFEASGVAVAGAYANTGSARGTSPAGTVVSAADGSSYFGSAPGIHVDTVTNGSDGPALSAGDPITWTSTVTNTGNVPLSAVSVDDDQLAPGADPVYMSGDTNANARLDLAEQWIFSASGIAVAGTHSNTVTASGTGPANDTVSDADDSSYVGSASVSVEEFVIADDGLEDSSPAISGATVVWGNGGSGQLDVWGCDLGATPLTPYPIWQSAFFKRGFAISGDTIVWSDARNSYLESTPFGYSDIYGYKLGASGGELEICRYAGEQLHPDIDGDFVVWSDNRSGAWEIYGLDLPVGSGEPFVIATGVGTSSDWVEPAVAGDVVVWGQTGGIFGWRRGGSVFPITTATSSAPAISGDIVVWSEYRDVGMDIYGYDLAEGAEFAVCTAAGSQTDPDIDGDRVVWTDDRSGAWDIYGCSLTTMATFPICTAQGEQYEPAVSGNVVVWSDTRSGLGYPDIWGARLTP